MGNHVRRRMLKTNAFLSSDRWRQLATKLLQFSPWRLSSSVESDDSYTIRAPPGFKRRGIDFSVRLLVGEIPQRYLTICIAATDGVRVVLNATTCSRRRVPCNVADSLISCLIPGTTTDCRQSNCRGAWHSCPCGCHAMSVSSHSNVFAI